MRNYYEVMMISGGMEKRLVELDDDSLTSSASESLKFRTSLLLLQDRFHSITKSHNSFLNLFWVNRL
jgi:hypothetical protein